MPTAEQDEFVRAVFGTDPSLYLTKNAAFDAPDSGVRGEATEKRDARLKKGQAAWLAVRKKVESDIAKLQKAVAAAYKGHDMAAELEEAFLKSVEPVLEQLDESLAHKIGDVLKADDADRPKLVAEARGIITSYERFLDGNQIVTMLDQNPVMPIAMRKTLDTALTTLASILD